MEVPSQKIIIDVVNNTAQGGWTNKGEFGVRELEIYVVKDNVVFDISTYNLTMYCITALGDKLFLTVNKTNAALGKASIMIPQQIAEQAGTTKCCISFIKKDQNLLSVDFKIKVNRSIYNEESIMASDDFSALQDALAGVANLEDNYVPKLTSLEKKMDGVDSQLADIVKPLIVNKKEGLKNFYKKTNPVIIDMGDSISAINGHLPTLCSGMKWNEQLANQFEVSYGKATNKSRKFIGATGWTFENKGINLSRIVGVVGSADYSVLATPNDLDMYAKIIYSTELDGGEFEIVVNNVVVQTVNCNGARKDNNHTSEFIIPNGTQSTYVRVKSGKVYIHGYYSFIVPFNSINLPHMFFNIATGGRKLLDYTDQEIVDNALLIKSDLNIFSIGANDYSQNIPVETFKTKAELYISSAINDGSSVLIQIMCGNDQTIEGQSRYELFKAYKQCLYDLQKKYNCALVDYDLALGGFAFAKSMGWIEDTIHPSVSGNKVMADLLIKDLLEKVNVYETYVANNSRYSQMRIFDNICNITRNKSSNPDLFSLDSVKIEVPNHRGYEGDYHNIQPVIARNGAGMPKDAPKGMLAFNTDSNSYQSCTTEAIKDANGNITTPCVLTNLGKLITYTSTDKFSTNIDSAQLQVMNENGASIGWNCFIQPIIDRARANFPKTPYRGMTAFNSDSNNLMMCTDVVTKTWEIVGGATVYDGVALPTATYKYSGKMAILRNTGADDILHICRRLANNSYEWKIINL